MKLPSLETALAAIGSLSAAGPTFLAGVELANIVVDLFDERPDDQAELKAKLADSRAKALAALDDLDDAIADARKG